MIARRAILRTALLSAILLPVIPAMTHAAPDAVSPKLAALVAEYARRTADLDALPEGDPAEDRVSDARMRSVDALLDYAPANLGELAEKLKALKPFMVEDIDFVSLDVILEDVRVLAGGFK